MSLISLAIEIYFTIVLIISGLAKIDDYEHFANILYHQGLISPKFVPLAARILPYIEIIIAFLIISGITSLFSAIILTSTFGFFLVVRCTLFGLGRTEDCGCYGKLKPEPINAASICTSILMLFMTIFHLWLAISTLPLPWQLRFAIILIFILGIAYFIVILTLRHKNNALEEFKRLKGFGSIKVGEPAPDFQAKDQSDNPTKLGDFRGRQLLLLFIMPGCLACRQALKELPTLQRERPHISFLAIGSSDSEKNRVYAQEQNIRIPLLTDMQGFTGNQYQIHSFPTAILLDENGIVRNKSFASNIQLLRHVTSLPKLKVR